MSIIYDNQVQACKYYGATVNATEAEVSDNANNLIYAIHVQNTTGAIAYLQVFDADAADVTVGTTVPSFAIGIPASGAVDVAFPKPIMLTTGFTIACTTARGGASDAACEVMIAYATSS